MWQTNQNRVDTDLLPPDDMSIIFLFQENFWLFVFFSRFGVELSLFEAKDALRPPATVRKEDTGYEKIIYADKH